jgi:hypothetical protein
MLLAQAMLLFPSMLCILLDLTMLPFLSTLFPLAMLV